MLLEDVQRHGRRICRYAERFLNDGSPSGLSERNSTSSETSPFGLRPHFSLPTATSESFKEFGDISRAPAVAKNLAPNEVAIHPDMQMVASEHFTLSVRAAHKALLATPTASGRTVQLISKKSDDYLKLHYAGVLGRITRELPYSKSIAGPETSIIVEKAIAAGRLPSSLHILSEPFARVLTTKRSGVAREWGMIYRSARPVGPSSDILHFTLPCFSLFSTDRLAVHHPPLLFQILSSAGRDPCAYLMDKIVAPLIDGYFSLLGGFGLQPEWNAQNIMFGFSEDLREVAIIMRDLESVDKDLTMMEQLGLDTQFESAPYKCIDASQYNYRIKHSFMYDFKLGECVLRPLFGATGSLIGLSFAAFAEIVRSMAARHLGNLPGDFFPRGVWYSFDNALVDQTKDARPYLEHSDPPFR